MKLVYITTNIESSGGVQRVLSVKLNYLTEVYNYDVNIINTHGNIDALFYDFSPKITFHNLGEKDSGFSRILKYQKQLNSLVQKIGPDIIINCDNGLKGALLPNIIRVKTPLIYEDHIGRSAKGSSFLASFKIRLQYFIHKMNQPRYSRILRFSQSDKEWSKSNFVLIPNPLPLDIPIENSSLTYKRVIAVGRYSYQKGYRRMLRIWKQILEVNQDWVLEIYGEGDFTDLMTLSKELCISETVIFNAPVKNIREKLLNSSILINTSFFESFGLSLLEAMSCGLPVISYDCEGPKIFIKNSINGVLVPQDHEVEYINTLLKMMNDMSLRKRIGNAAKESVKVYQKEPILSQWHELFQTIKSLN